MKNYKTVIIQYSCYKNEPVEKFAIVCALIKWVAPSLKHRKLGTIKMKLQRCFGVWRMMFMMGTDIDKQYR